MTDCPELASSTHITQLCANSNVRRKIFRSNHTDMLESAVHKEEADRSPDKRRVVNLDDSNFLKILHVH